MPNNVHSGTGMNLMGKLRQLVKENKDLQHQLQQDTIGRLRAELMVLQAHRSELLEQNECELAPRGSTC